MNIRNKTLAIFGFTFVLLMILLTLSAGQIIGNSFQQLEEEEVAKNVDRATEAIDVHINQMENIAADWGYWEDTYYFIKGENEEYIDLNIVTGALVNLEINMMLFYDNDKQLYYIESADILAEEKTEVADDIIETIESNDNLFSSLSNPAYESGIISTSEGPLLIASYPITDGGENIGGTLIIARYLDDALITEIEETTKLHINILPASSGDISSLENKTTNIEYLNQDSVIGTNLLNDINGNPVYELEVEMTRTIYQQGKTAEKYLLYSILILGIVYSSVMIFSLEKYVLSRLATLNSNLKDITTEGTLSSRVTMSGDDELADLAGNINFMLQSLENKENNIQQAEALSRKRLESIINNIISGVLIIDEKTHNITDVNPVAAETIGLPKEEIIGKLCHEFVCPAENGKCPINDRGETVHCSERVLINSEGERIPILKSVVSISIGDNSYLIESFVDLSKIKETEKDLMHAKIMAESANRAKSDFLATMSHELRTPLNSIIGFSDLMLEGNVGETSPRQEKYLSNISTSGKHLLSLINNVLDLSKIEAGKMELHPEGFPVEDVLMEVRQLMSSLAGKKNIEITYTKEETIGKVYADKTKLKQILYNLLSNAVKFTPKGGTIDVKVENAGNMVRFSVQDSGIGISSEDMKKLFTPFTQLDSAENRQYEGSGLGLTLVKKFVELHNGTLEVESEPGKGTKFIFDLAIKEDPREKENKDNDTVKNTVEIDNDETSADTAYVNPENSEGDEELILVVEDEDSSRELLEETLKSSGYRVVSTSRGQEALELAEKMQPIAITLDIMMPGMDGWEVLNKLKNNGKTKDIPVIITTMLDEREIGTALGAEEHFIKPIDKKTLIATLERIRKDRKDSPFHLLVVDDEKIAVEMIEEMLEGTNFEVTPAFGGQEAIDITQREHPDAILLDLMMPNVTGFDVIKTLKSNEESHDIPIIVCTAKYLEKEDLEILNKNIAGVIQKGDFNREKLIFQIKSLKK
ncbi:response regulator [Methanolobus vulcani]|uniref:histidine kinase n=1 Tax=Methanolobus vulcani TaxID=38026 RepID=A0A7Z8KPA3_9EURY|nr:response regulator [Methanolobus vulcani]TQD25031.1 response regulator [Methanolobus vulcani]